MRFKSLSRKLAFFLVSTWGVVASVKGQDPMIGYKVFIDNLMLDQTLNLNYVNSTPTETLFSKLIYEKSQDGYNQFNFEVKADYPSSSTVKLTFTATYYSSIKTLSLPAEITENGSFFHWLTSYQNQIIGDENTTNTKPTSVYNGKVVIFSCSKTDFKNYYHAKLKWKTRKNGFFVNATLGVSHTRRRLQVEDPQFTNTKALSDRTNGESGLNSFPASLALGYRHGNHEFSAGAEYATFGISTRRPVNNTTGLPSEVSDNNSLNLKYFLLVGGLTYAYTAFRPGLSSYFQTGLQIGQDNNQDFIVNKTGFGFSYKRCSDFAIKVYPIIQWDLTKVKGTQISTHMYNFGLEFGVSYLFWSTQ